MANTSPECAENPYRHNIALCEKQECVVAGVPPGGRDILCLAVDYVRIYIDGASSVFLGSHKRYLQNTAVYKHHAHVCKLYVLCGTLDYAPKFNCETRPKLHLLQVHCFLE